MIPYARGLRDVISVHDVHHGNMRVLLRVAQRGMAQAFSDCHDSGAALEHVSCERMPQAMGHHERAGRGLGGDTVPFKTNTPRSTWITNL
jgi:hypothetical protein